MSATPRPTTMKREGDVLHITWDDGVTTRVSWQTLRQQCPCASCLDERSKPSDPFRVLKSHEVEAGPLAPKAMKPIGHYAYQITWNDGHDSGIYTLETLRKLGE